MLGLVLLLPLATSIYLARKLRTQSEEKGRSSGPGGTSVGAVSAVALLVLPLILVVLEADPTPAAMFLLWGAGLVLLWLSDAWTAREKAVATLIAPGAGRSRCCCSRDRLRRARSRRRRGFRGRHARAADLRRQGSAPAPARLSRSRPRRCAI